LRISIGLALSISIVGLLTIIQAFTGSWSPVTVVLLTVLITVTFGCIEIARERRRVGA
jgi:CHASE2 domain-containing sensor protein